MTYFFIFENNASSYNILFIYIFYLCLSILIRPISKFSTPFAQTLPAALAAINASEMLFNKFPCTY